MKDSVPIFKGRKVRLKWYPELVDMEWWSHLQFMPLSRIEKSLRTRKSLFSFSKPEGPNCPRWDRIVRLKTLVVHAQRECFPNHPCFQRAGVGGWQGQGILKSPTCLLPIPWALGKSQVIKQKVKISFGVMCLGASHRWVYKVITPPNSRCMLWAENSETKLIKSVQRRDRFACFLLLLLCPFLNSGRHRFRSPDFSLQSILYLLDRTLKSLNSLRLTVCHGSMKPIPVSSFWTRS